MNNVPRSIVISFALACLSVSQSNANLVVNGDFETPQVPNGAGFVSYPHGNLGGWLVGEAGIDLVKPANWIPVDAIQPSPSGDQYVDLTGFASGSISQNLITTAGEYYTLRFWIISGDNTSLFPHAVITWGGLPLSVLGMPWHSTGWYEVSIPHLLATGTDTELKFATPFHVEKYPFLDDIRVTPWVESDGLVSPTPPPQIAYIPDSGSSLGLFVLGVGTFLVKGRLTHLLRLR